MDDKIPAEERKVTQLQPARMKFAEHERNQWFVVPETGTPFEALLDPSVWAHVAHKMKPCDEIIVHAEDGEYYGKLLVQDAGRLYAKVAPIAYVELHKLEVLQGGGGSDGYEVKWRGPMHKWCVLRGKDVLKDSMTKADAERWRSEHIRTITAPSAA